MKQDETEKILRRVFAPQNFRISEIRGEFHFNGVGDLYIRKSVGKRVEEINQNPKKSQPGQQGRK